MGKLHPLLVHLPIGFLLIAFLMEVFSRWPAFGKIRPAILFVLFAGAVAAVFTVATGLMMGRSGGYDTIILQRHQWLGISVAFFSILLYGIKSGIAKNPFLKKAELLFWFVLFFTLTAAGHLGGSLTHGQNYLAGLLGKNSPQPGNFSSLEEARLYEDIIAPIFSEKCLSCHNGDKLKGGLRLDSLQYILEGGKNGVCLVPFKPQQSRLYQYLFLPDTAAAHMPPLGKPQLLPYEAALVEWWILEGALSGKKISDLKVNERIRPVLEGLRGKGVTVRSDIPKIMIPAADKNVLLALRKAGISVLPVYQNSPYLTAGITSESQNLDAVMPLLLKIEPQLIWLKLDDPNINDEHIQTISRLGQLTRLDLSNTCISDSALIQLSTLTKLQWLNVFNTPVTDIGLQYIKKAPSLKEMFVFNTSITAVEASSTMQQIPSLTIEFGGYKTKKLLTDTIVYKKTAY